MKHIYIFNISTRSSQYGIGTYVTQLINCLKNANVKLHLITVFSSDKEVSVIVKNNIQYISVPTPMHFSHNDEYGKALDKAYNAVIYLIKPHIDNNNENIFHINNNKCNTLVAGLKKHFKCKIVFTLHYTEWSFALLGDKKQMIKILRKQISELNEKDAIIANSFNKEKELLNKYCDKIIAISKHSFQDVIDFYEVDPSKVYLVNNALPLYSSGLSEYKKKKLRNEFYIDMNENILIFAGRLDPVKGIHILIKAFSEVLKHHPNTRLYIVGSGYIYDCLSCATGIWSKVSFTGFINKKLLNKLYSIANIGIVPSLHEEFGYVAIEMMRHGLPIIVNDTTGLSEIVQDNKTGLWTNLKANNMNMSIENLVAKINYLICDHQKRIILGMNAKKYFNRKFSTNLFKRNLLDIYNNW